MEPLMITAHLARAFVAYDQWTPAIDSLIQSVLLEEKGLRSANPSPEEVAANQHVLDLITPIATHTFGDLQILAASAPHYELAAQQTTTYYKRWTGHDSGLDWGKKQPKWNESAGFFKNYNLPNYSRVAQSVHWFVVGDRAELTRILTTANVLAIGKKSSQGHGMVVDWQVTPIAADASIICGGNLAKIVPAALAPHLPADAIAGCAIAHRTWHSPYWMVANATACLMPAHNVVVANARNRA